MSKPNPDDYKNYGYLNSFDFAGYIADLKTYCEELEKELDKACELLARNDILQINSTEEWHEWFDRYGHNKKG